MKNKIKLFIAVLLISIFSISSVCFGVTEYNYKIDFNYWDSGLEIAVRNALSLVEQKDKSIGYIYNDDLKKITELSIDYNDVSNIRGIEKLTNLEILKIYTNSNKDIKVLNNRIFKYVYKKSYRGGSYLGRLKSLKKIDLSNNDIEDVSYIAAVLINMNRLKKLDVSNNKIKDISVFSKYHGLEELNISNNKINDISSLRYLKNLEKLDMSNNLVQNIYPLRYLVKLKSLNVSGNNIENLYPLERCTKIEEFYMSGNIQFKDIVSDKYIEISTDNVIDKDKLKINGRYIRIYSEEWNDNYTIYNNRYVIYHRDYTMYNKKPVDIAPISQLTSLKKLDLSENYLTNIYPIEGLINLEYLNLNNNNINDISSIRNMIKLKELYVQTNNQIEDINALINLSNLETLNLSNNNINDIYDLKNLTRLKYLDLSHNNVSNIDPIEVISPHEDVKTGEKFTGLIELKLNDNRIENIYGLIGLTNLEKLYLQNEDIYGNNYINDPSPLKNLPNLKEVILPNN